MCLPLLTHGRLLRQAGDLGPPPASTGTYQRGPEPSLTEGLGGKLAAVVDPRTDYQQPEPSAGPTVGEKAPAVDRNLAVEGVAADLANLASLGVGGPEAAAAGGAGKAIFVAAAKMRDRAALTAAQKMAAKGASPEEIWAVARRFQDAGGNWTGEIPDLGSKMRSSGRNDFGAHPLSEHLEHPALSEGGPAIDNIPTSQIGPMVREFVGENTLGFMEPGKVHALLIVQI
jgi:hypothetical protein